MWNTEFVILESGVMRNVLEDMQCTHGKVAYLTNILHFSVIPCKCPFFSKLLLLYYCVHEDIEHAEQGVM